ncbi:hypothetical protein SAMN05414139_04461 [Burkholderia sp. D7]|nr:hypothetical protein SAMN05414139_04461 [Burkholderia sp. D7]
MFYCLWSCTFPAFCGSLTLNLPLSRQREPITARWYLRAANLPSFEILVYLSWSTDFVKT